MHVFITSSNHHVIDMLIHEQVSGNLKCSFFLSRAKVASKRRWSHCLKYYHFPQIRLNSLTIFELYTWFAHFSNLFVQGKSWKSDSNSSFVVIEIQFEVTQLLQKRSNGHFWIGIGFQIKKQIRMDTLHHIIQFYKLWLMHEYVHGIISIIL